MQAKSRPTLEPLESCSRLPMDSAITSAVAFPYVPRSYCSIGPNNCA